MKKKWLKIVICVIVVCAVMVGMILTKKWQINSWSVSKYEVQGIDVSHYQGMIDWAQIQDQGIDFAFIKATEGSGYVDECFYDNWQAAEQTDLMIGAYHFFSFDSGARSQAALFIETVGNLTGKITPVIDIEFYGDKWNEPPGKEDVTEQLGEMLLILEEYYHTKPIIYTTYNVYYQYIKGGFKEYPLWIRNVYFPPDWHMKGEWTFWQYTDTAVMSGYVGEEQYIDRNVFCGETAELEALLVQ